jgi:tRNA1(Val) A37 N6-methylase TrmN6
MPDNIMMTDISTTRDRWHNGRLWLTQPADGFRATSDAIMLAAAIPEQSRHVLELGVGAGAVMMIMAHRLPAATFTGIDADSRMLKICAVNAADNDFAGRISLREMDIALAECQPEWDHVVMNPPFNDPQSSLSPSPQKRQSMAADFALPWIACASSALMRRGGLTMICRADQLDQMIMTLSAHDFGEYVVRPVYSRLDKPAIRVLIRARKGMAGAMTLLPPLLIDSDEYHALSDGASIALNQPGRNYAVPISKSGV